MTTICPFLWFDDDLEDAIDFYSGIFPEAKVHSINRTPDGSVMTADFELAGQAIKGLNGGPIFPFTEAISLFVTCDDVAEVDRLWDALVADGGQHSQCGWLKDRFGLSWQIVPAEFLDLMANGEPQRAAQMMETMMGMTKLDLPTLKAAYER